jgi:hypothetical protein
MRNSTDYNQGWDDGLAYTRHEALPLISSMDSRQPKCPQDYRSGWLDGKRFGTSLAAR